MYDDEESLYGDHHWSGSDSGDFAEEADLTEASAEELLAEFGKGDTLGAIQGYREERIGYDERMGGITGADLQLRRVQGQPAEVQQAIKHLTGTNWRKNSVGGVNSETDATRVRAERAWNDGNVGSSTSLSQFSDRIKVDTNAFAGDVYARNGSVLRKGGVQPKHYKKAMTFLEGIGANIDMGPGGKLTGVTGDEELDAGHSNELNAAFQFIDRLADKYIPQATKDSRVYGARKEAVVGALTNRMVEGRTLKDSTGYYHNEKKKLASPADLNVAGLIDNKAWGKGHTEWVGFSEFSQEEWNAANLANSTFLLSSSTAKSSGQPEPRRWG